MYIHIFLVHIKIFSYTYKFLPVHNTDTFCKYSNTDKLRSFVSVSSIYTLNTIGIKRSIIPGETAFKPMGHPYGVSPNPPMYIHTSLYINTRSCTYLLPCTQFKLVNNQVTLVSNVRFTHTCLYFLQTCK